MLAKHILTTIAYYDVMNFPMTSFEVWKYLITLSPEKENGEYTLREIVDCLDKDDSLRGKVESFHGFYFLRGRQELVRERIIREKISSQKLKKIRRVVRWIRLTPFVRMVAVTGRVAMRNAKSESDLDLFIIFRSGRMFTGRAIMTLLVHLLGVRRHGNMIQDRICLNYFASEDGLEVVDKDLFASSEYSFILPVFDKGMFLRFQEANLWIRRYRPNYSPSGMLSSRAVEDTLFSRILRNAGEYLFDWNLIESSLRKWQLGRIGRDPRTHKEGSRIIADEKMLLFLPIPQGPKIWERFSSRIGELG